MIIAIQSNKHQPLPDHRDHNPLDVSLTWLMKQIDADALTAQFKIDTQHPDTKTPRCNKQVDDTLAFLPVPHTPTSHQLRSISAGNIFYQSNH
jgi:hypothetical protein